MMTAIKHFTLIGFETMKAVSNPETTGTPSARMATVDRVVKQIMSNVQSTPVQNEGLTKTQFMSDLKRASEPLGSREPGRKLSRDEAIAWTVETYSEALKELKD